MGAVQILQKPYFEAFLIGIYAFIINAGALVMALALFLGRDAMEDHLGISAYLLVFASVTVFGVAWFALRRGPINTPGRGLRLGLIAAGLFYGVIVVVFGLIPLVAYLPSGNVCTAAGYLGDVVRITMLGSYGLPVIIGALGGALYGWVKKQRHKYL